MGKIKSTLKVLIFIWSILSLALVLVVTITLTVQSLTNRETAENDQKEAYEKRFDKILFTVQEKSDKNQNALFINISKSGKTLVSNYRLPIEKYGLGFPIQIKNAKLITVKEKVYRVILYTTHKECEEEAVDYIWFLKLTDKLSLVHVVDLTDLTENKSNKLSFFGYKHINLPYFENAEFKHFIIPIEVTVGETINTSPLLNKSGMNLLKMAYTTEAEKRIAAMNQTQNIKMLEEYKESLRNFKVITTESSIPY